MSDIPEMERDFSPTANIESLKRRSKLLRRLRDFFDERGFLEVETPLLSADTVVDRYIQPIKVDRSAVTGAEIDQGRAIFLQTSPEFAMKRLVVGGAKSIYQICKAFRQGESGRSHNPEFTMLEWYRVGDDMQAAMGLLSDLVESTLELPAAQKMSYRNAFLTFAKVDISTANLAQLSQLSGLGLDEERDEHLNLILVNQVEPNLGHDAPVLLYDFPASQAALAKTRFEDGVEYAERFEIYVRGVELANGYHELLDADELLARNEKVNQQRVGDGRDPLPADSRLLDAMREGMPACAGVALGVDRLFMLSQNLDSIGDAIAFPFARA